MIGAPVIPDATKHAPRIVHAAAAITIFLGLFFVFVRPPHPFGWEGIDHYHDLALRLARGEAFPTTDVPWGYAYFLAAFYRLAGDRPWVPLVAQVLLNGLVPGLLYRLVREELGSRTAIVATLLVSVLSFNTVYASTQASDSVCTVIFLAGLTIFARALRTNDLRRFAVSGLLAGLASQFRPNLILFPAVLAVVTAVMTPRTRRRALLLTAYVLLAGAVSIPWIVRNYRLTGELIPTSTHGGVQLWYGTLQTGPHLRSRAHNPRSLFEPSAFDYSSRSGRPLLVSASLPCEAGTPVDLLFWTDRAERPQRAVRVSDPEPGALAFTVSAQPDRTALYYYFAASRPDGAATFTPAAGPKDPFVFFVDDRHLADLDRHGDLLDAFDVIRVLRGIGFDEPVIDSRLDVTHNGHVDADDLGLIVRTLLADENAVPPNVQVTADVTRSPDAVAVRFIDGSSIEVPRVWSGMITDLAVTPGIAARLCYTRRRWTSLEATPPAGAPDMCRTIESVRVNAVFYLSEPHQMRRYTALAWDNIRRAPGAFAAASAYRAVRMFVVQGTSDASTGWQFEGSRTVYAVATLASLSYVLTAVAGVIVAIRRRQRVWFLLTPLVYIPATICFVLTNMRYTITVQPLLIAFVAVALTAAVPTAGPSDTRTASPPS
jgi:hypothetical protein